MIGKLGNDCFVGVYLLRYKGKVYIAILFVGTSECVRNSREFAITVFVLTLIFSYLYKGIIAGDSKLCYTHEFTVCVFVIFVLYGNITIPIPTDIVKISHIVFI